MTWPNELSRRTLLKLERICDSYERDLRNHKAKSFSRYLKSLSGPIRTHAIKELDALRRAYEHRSSTVEKTLSEAMPEHSDELKSAPQLDRFEYLHRIGSGGCASVWKAYDRQLDRMVAIKLSHGKSNETSEAALERFVCEARAVAKFRHPRIVRIYEVIPMEDRVALVCEFIEGKTLADVAYGPRMDFKRIARIIREIADALGHAHHHGIVHRDIKPHNILIDGDGNPHVTDFGLAWDMSQQSSRLTVTGTLVGTPAFMSPEQANEEKFVADPRTDIYSLGVVLYYLLSGDVPFRGNVARVIHQVAFSEVPGLRQWDASIPADLETICLRCLQKSPASRFQSMDELGTELHRFERDRPIQSRPIGSWERLIRWSRRNKRLAALAATVLLLLTILGIGSTAYSVHLRQARTRESQLLAQERKLRLAAERATATAKTMRRTAIEAQQAAEKHATLAGYEAKVRGQTIVLLEELLVSADPLSRILGHDSATLESSSSDATLRDSLASIAMKIRDDFDAESSVKAYLMDTVANLCRGVGLFDDARILFDLAEQTRPNDSALTDRVRHRFYRGWLAQDLGEYGDACRQFSVALELIDKAASTGTQLDLLTADICFQYAQVRHALSDHPHSLRLFNRCLKIRQRHFPSESNQVLAARAGVAFCSAVDEENFNYADLSQLFSGNSQASRLAGEYVQIKLAESLGNRQRAVDLYRPLVQQLSQQLGSNHPLYLLALGEFAGMLWEVGDYRHAQEAGLHAMRAGQKLAPGHHRLRGPLMMYGYELLRAERYDEARQCFVDARAIKRSDRTLDYDAIHGLFWVEFACENFTMALDHSDAMIQHMDRFTATQAAWTLFCRAQALIALDRSEDAQSFMNRALRIAQNLSDAPNHAIWLGRLATILRVGNDPDAALKFITRAIEVEHAERPADHPRTSDREMSLAILLRQSDRDDEAIELAQKVLANRTKRLPKSDLRISETKNFIDSSDENLPSWFKGLASRFSI